MLVAKHNPAGDLVVFMVIRCPMYIYSTVITGKQTSCVSTFPSTFTYPQCFNQMSKRGRCHLCTSFTVFKIQSLESSACRCEKDRRGEDESHLFLCKEVSQQINNGPTPSLFPLSPLHWESEADLFLCETNANHLSQRLTFTAVTSAQLTWLCECITQCETHS